MSITKQQFEQGMTIEDYRAQMTRNRERFEANERTVSLRVEDVHFFAQLPQPLHVIVITEDWCEPAIACIPVLVRLAAESGKLNLRFFLRDHNPDLMNQYLKDGVHATIPTFVFFDQTLWELGRWIEQPAKISELLQTLFEELFTTDPAFAGVPFETPIPQLPEAARKRLFEALTDFGVANRELGDRETVREIREIVERGLEINL